MSKPLTSRWKLTAALATTAFAAAAFAAAPAVAGSKASNGKASVINWKMTPTTANLNAKGKIQFKDLPGNDQFNVTVHNLALGTYDFRVDGAVVGMIQVGSGNNGRNQTGRLRLKGKHGMGFDPHGASLAVSQGGVDYLVADFPDCDDEDEIEVDAVFVPTGAIPGAAGDVEFESEDGETEFEVDIHGLPAGSYDLLVGGVIVGTILVDSGGMGEIEFSTDVDDKDDDGVCDHDPLLDFDPMGQPIQVAQNGVVILEVTFPAAPQTATCDDDDDDDQGEDED